jgi:3D (Asp-Asp-Asp) domain-containing protein
MDLDELKWKNLSRNERIALVALLAGLSIVFLAGGLRFPGDSGAPPVTAPPVTAAPDTAAFTRSTTTTTATLWSYKGITEGDVIPGELTFYCRCEICCEKWALVVPQKTADGTLLDEVDETREKIAGAGWLPFGSIVAVDGTEYRIADRGGGVRQVGRLDIYTPEGHAEALRRGRVRGAEIKIIYIAEERA